MSRNFRMGGLLIGTICAAAGVLVVARVAYQIGEWLFWPWFAGCCWGAMVVSDLVANDFRDRK